MHSASGSKIPGLRSYIHPHKYPLSLSDIFVYPDLREIHYEREGVDQPVIRSRDAVTYILNNGYVVVIAEEKAGKTTLTKSLIKDLHHNGKVAVALDGESLRHCLDGDRLRKAIDSKLDEEFGSGHAERFWQNWNRPNGPRGRRRLSQDGRRPQGQRAGRRVAARAALGL